MIANSPHRTQLRQSASSRYEVPAAACGPQRSHAVDVMLVGQEIQCTAPDALFLVSLDTSWMSSDSPQVVRDNLEWLTALHEDIGEYTDNASYLNFTDPDLADWWQACHGPNLARLGEVKRRYDPDRFFSFSQAV